MRVASHDGNWMPPSSRPGEINYPFMDRFTLIHFGIGMGYAAWRLSFASTIALAITWEIIENPLKVYVPELFPHATADTWKNSLGDTLAVACGWLSSSYFVNLY